MRHVNRSVLAVVALGAALTACGADPAEQRGPATTAPEPTTTTTELVTPTTSDVTVPPNGETVTIKAVDNTFVEEETTVAAGTEVIWENRGRNDHNVIAQDPEAPWVVEADDFEPGESASFTFTRAGTYRFYCSIHGTIDAGMPGVLIVE